MENNLVNLPKGIKIRKCPGCGYLEPQISVDMARYNFACPRFWKYKLNDFIPDNMPLHKPKCRKKKVA